MSGSFATASTGDDLDIGKKPRMVVVGGKDKEMVPQGHLARSCRPLIDSLRSDHPIIISNPHALATQQQCE